MTPEPLVARLRAGDRTLALVTTDEETVLDLAEAAAAATGHDLRVWTCLDPGETAATDLEGLLLALEDRPAGELWVAFDAALDPPSHRARRRLRERLAREDGPALWLVQPERGGLAGLPDLPILAVGPPGRDVLEAEVAACLGDDVPAAPLAEAGLGLSRLRFRRLLARLGDRGGDARALSRAIVRAKTEEVASVGHLSFADPVPLDWVGGLFEFKRWLALRALAFDPRARAAGIDWPRGILLLGPPGCGKSLAAKATASALDLPLLRLDPGRLFAGTVGASEANLRATLAAVERAAPVVVWIDEIEKGFSGSDGGRSDAGTAARVVGTFLTWLAERARPVFVVATANRLSGLPPELVRPGRFDGRFFVDLPDERALREILAVHLARLPADRLDARPPLADPLDAFLALAGDAEGCTGAELADAVTEARLLAFAEDRPLAARDLARALADTVPAAELYAEEIAALRAFAQRRLRRA